MPELSFVSRSLSDNLDISRQILKACKNVRIFAFYGNLGAGKTTLIKGFSEVLGVREPVTSPTFNLIHEYRGAETLIYHFDFYRIKSEAEAYDLGVEEYFYSDSYSFIEWPERIPTLLPEDAARITLSILDEQSRNIHLTY
ncbi:MAG: tRNA (adenosine(37)-N6)-threonylcarbamoyltransferase complex ATPase subunit type 1 TsaE [Bacteroidota bacterium]